MKNENVKESKNKKSIPWLIKALIAAIMSFIALNIFAFFFYNYGMRMPSKTGATDYVWKEGVYFQAYEGYGYGKHDKNGYNNAWKTSEGHPIDILVLGSSQMEANNVSQEENTVYILNQNFNTFGMDIYAYNMAMEGHTIERQVAHLDTALETFKPEKYVVFETMGIEFDIDSINRVLDGSYESLSYEDSSLAAHYAKYCPYLRLMYAQYSAAKYNKMDKPEKQKIIAKVPRRTPEAPKEAETGYSYEEMQVINEFFASMNDKCSKYGCKAVLLYIPTAYIKDGKYSFEQNEIRLYQIKTACSSNNIMFVDLTEVFTTCYETTHILPYGFDNTAFGKGNLNVYGHKLIADKLTREIMRNMEAANYAVQ